MAIFWVVAGWGSQWLWDAVREQVNGRVDWHSFAHRTKEGIGWWKDENTDILLQYGKTVTHGIDEQVNLWQGFNVPFQQWVGPILLTVYWPEKGHWDSAFDYAPIFGEA